jgi:hypothetical protein
MKRDALQQELDLGCGKNEAALMFFAQSVSEKSSQCAPGLAGSGSLL